MATPFLGSEEYDDRAHRLYNDGEYDAALETLKEGLALYPDSVELHVGLGYTRLAREEFAWARQSFEHALILDPDHEDGLVGLGEVLLRFGRRAEALDMFERARAAGCAEDLDLLLSMGRALYRERLYEEARDVFAEAISLHPHSAEAAACLGYVLHRFGDERGARRYLRRALRLDPDFAEARIYLGHLNYDRGDWAGALEQFERVSPGEHWDTLAIWRVLELKRTLHGVDNDSTESRVWEARLEELDQDIDPIDELLAELEERASDAGSEPVLAPPGAGGHRVRMPDGRAIAGTWHEIVLQLRDAWGDPGESIAQFMRRHADETRARTGTELPSSDAESFVRAIARTGMLYIEG